MQKFLDAASANKSLQIASAMYTDIKGYVYVESFKEAHVREARQHGHTHTHTLTPPRPAPAPPLPQDVSRCGGAVPVYHPFAGPYPPWLAPSPWLPPLP